MDLMFRGSVSLSSILTDEGAVIESASVSQPVAAAGATVHWQSKGTVEADSVAVLELGSLPMLVFGDEGEVGFSAVHAIYLRNTGAVALEVGEWGQLVAGGHVSLRPGGLLMLTAPGTGLPVAAGDCISITAPSAGEGSYEILIVGAKA